MILEENINIIITTSNLKHYLDLGYDIKIKDIISIKVSELKNCSHTKIHVKCDKCGKEKHIEYKSLFKNNYLSEYTCASCKRKENLLIKYGVANIFQLEETKEKSKETNKIKYGCEYISQNNEIKEKIKKTCLKKYGVEYALSNDDIKSKIKDTVNKKYNVDNISQLEDIKKKKEKTCLKNNGVDIISKHIYFKNTIKNNNIKKLSEKHNIKIIDIAENYFILECSKCGKNFEINKKCFYTRLNLKTIICTHCNPVNSFSTSGFELQLQEFIKENYIGDIILNSRKIISPYELDIYLPDLKLAFEFDGLYWHSDLYVDKNYHLMKTKMCEKIGIQLFHIFEDEWIYKQEIIKSIILNNIK